MRSYVKSYKSLKKWQRITLLFLIGIGIGLLYLLFKMIFIVWRIVTGWFTCLIWHRRYRPLDFDSESFFSILRKAILRKENHQSVYIDFTWLNIRLISTVQPNTWLVLFLSPDKHQSKDDKWLYVELTFRISNKIIAYD